jgi:hypothetical protein
LPHYYYIDITLAIGLIFFKYFDKGVWKQKSKNLWEHIILRQTKLLGSDAGKGNLMPIIKQKSFIFPSERLQGELYGPTIAKIFNG